MVRDKTHLSLFNMPLVKSMEYPKGDNLVQDVFQESVKMSTYLVAFVVCDYASLKNTTKRGTKVRPYYVKINELPHKKTCLWGFRPGLDTSPAVQPLKMARGLKFCMQEV